MGSDIFRYKSAVGVPLHDQRLDTTEFGEWLVPRGLLAAALALQTVANWKKQAHGPASRPKLGAFVGMEANPVEVAALVRESTEMVEKV